ncbi:MAG: mechanosensitive ion channel family protein [Pseudomonadota bacterium]
MTLKAMIESLLSLTFWVRGLAWIRGAGLRRAIGRYCALTVALALASATAAAQQAGGEGAASENLYERIEQVQREGGRIVVQPSVDSVGQPGVWDYGSAGATGAQTAQAEQPGFDAGAYERLAQNSMSVLDRSQQGVAAFRSRLEAIVAAAPSAYDEMRATLASASPTGEPQYFLKVFLVVVAGLTVGWLFERLVYGYRIVGPWFVAQQVPNPQGYTEKLPILALRVLLTIGGIAIACTVSIMLGLVFYEPHEATQKTAIVILATYALIRLTEATWRMVISPFLPNYRIPCFDDRQAIKLFRWLYFVAAFSLTSLAGCLWMEALGLPFEIHVLMTSGFSLLTVLLNFALIRANHGAISYAILGGCTGESASVLARAAAAIWAPAAILYFAVAWAEMSYRLVMDQPLGVPLIAGAYMILLAIIVVYGGVSYVIEWIFRRQRLIKAINAGGSVDGAGTISSTGTGVPFAGGYRMRSMEDLARRVASVLAVLAGAWAISWIWGVEAAMSEESGAFEWAFDLLWIAFIGYVLYQATRIAIDQKIEEEGGLDVGVEPGDEGGGAAAATRLATLLPLFRNFLMVTIAIVTFMMLLLEAGVNVTPLFAGAGVVGLAIGFGAQTLVRDIFSGAFFLIDDAFRKGEYIDIGSVKGTVEKISVRSFQLRHHLGYLHTIPFGEVQHLTNYSRDWVIMKLPLRLTYDTDVEKVRKLIKVLGQQLLEDPEIGEKFLQPVKSQGVYQMEESAMIIRVKFMTRPGEQWIIRKRVYAEIRELFEREGIKFAHREVTVHVAGKGAETMSEDEKKAVAGAARPLLDPPEGERPVALQDER